MLILDKNVPPGATNQKKLKWGRLGVSGRGVVFSILFEDLKLTGWLFLNKLEILTQLQL